LPLLPQHIVGELNSPHNHHLFGKGIHRATVGSSDRSLRCITCQKFFLSQNVHQRDRLEELQLGVPLIYDMLFAEGGPVLERLRRRLFAEQLTPNPVTVASLQPQVIKHCQSVCAAGMPIRTIALKSKDEEKL